MAVNEACHRVEIARQDGGFMVQSGSGTHQGLMIHGYGGNSLEMLGLTVALACVLELRMLVVDLPGHGAAAGEPLTRAAALSCLESAAASLENPRFFIGHSLGARLGLEAASGLGKGPAGGLETAVLISMPGAAAFEGSKSEMLRTLRARRVREAVPYSGLEEILAGKARPAKKTLFITAGRELESVKSLAAAWEEIGVPRRTVRGCGHNDIVGTGETATLIAGWLGENL